MPPREGGLRVALDRIRRQTTTREAFAVDGLRAIANRTGATASVVLRDDPLAGRLSTVHAFGLAADALVVLCDPELWNVPRRAMRERLICVIDSAHESPFVPNELVAVNPEGLSIAVIPLFEGNEPRGVLVLFVPSCNGFSDEVTAMLGGTIRAFATEFLDLPDASTLQRTIGGLKSENERFARSLAEAERLRAAEAVHRVTAESFLDAEHARVLSLEREVESLRAAAAAEQRAHEDEKRTWGAERMALIAERERLGRARPDARDTTDGMGRIDELIRSLAEKERVLKDLLTPPADAASEDDGDEPIGVVHLTAGELPREVPLPRTRTDSPRPAVLLVDPTEHVATLRRCLDAHGFAACTNHDPKAVAVPPVGCAVNLATAAGWRCAAEIGSMWARDRPGIAAYVLPASADRGTWLGMLGVFLRPGNSATLLEHLRAFVAHPSRVMLVSSDRDAMRNLFEQTKAANVSTAVVSQGTKVADLLPIVRPEAALLHVSPASPGSFAALAVIRGHATYRDLPLLCLLDPTPDTDESSFFDGGMRRLVEADPLPASRVIEAVAAAAAAQRPR